MGGMTVYGATPNALELIREMGSAIHKSGIAGCDNEDQGRVLAMTCVAKGVDPLSLAERYDIIKGKLSMKASIMLAEFESRGGTYRQIQRDGNGASIELTKDGKTQTYSLSWEDAQAEPFVYNGKEADVVKLLLAKNAKSLAERLKPKYATPRSRTQMLWARVISDGVRAMDPGVCGGIYTPEEVGDFEPVEHRQAAPATDAASGGVTPSSAASATPDGVVDAEFEVAKSQPEASKMQAATDGPCDQAQIEKAKSLLRQVAQMEGNAGIADRLKAKLQTHGMAKLSDLSQVDADKLIEALTKKNMELFFDASLAGHSPGEQS